MINAMSLTQIATICDGHVVGDAWFERVCTDTRTLQQGDLYIAISGEHFDGNDFIEQAVAKGAIAIVGCRKPKVEVPYLLVDDPLRVFGLIARNNRRQFNSPVIALTGSTGKTTCKEMLAAILGECGNVLATQGNFNNEVGVPLTLLKMGLEHQSAVIEMGANQSGDIRYLCQFAEPTIAVVTNAMVAHIEGFGDIETVASTKGEVFENLLGDGLVIINLDDPFAERWLVQAGNNRVMTFSTVNQQADVYSKNIQITTEAELRFVVCTAQGEVPIVMSLLGKHNVVNALAASATAIGAGANLQQVKNGLAKVRSVSGRLQSFTTPSGNIVIDDSYNANPGSVKAAIDVLVDCAKTSSDQQCTTCLVLGTMAELGEQALQYHQDVAIYAREQGITQLITVGEFASSMMQLFLGKGAAFHHIDELLLKLDELVQADIVLVKGSRSAHMEKVVSALVGSSSVVNKNLGEH